MPSNATTTQVYNSTYRNAVDEKRRVQIPAMWRPVESGVQFTLIVWPKYAEGTCLRVLPPRELAELMASLDAMPNGDPNKTRLKRIIGSKSTQVVPDKAGRICLPEEAAKAAGIEDEALLVGLLDRFEIWTPARYEKINATDEAISHEAFKLME
jgi:MraZ protein